MTGMEKLQICVAYDIEGERVETMPMSQTGFHHARPIYEEWDGWWEDITKARTFDDLPDNAQRYVLRLEELCGAPVNVLGVGPGRDENVVRRPLLA
jgi:adenylosuccinate synthase